MVAVCLTCNHVRLHTKRTIGSGANQRPSIRPLQFRPDVFYPNASTQLGANPLMSAHTLLIDLKLDVGGENFRSFQPMENKWIVIFEYLDCFPSNFSYNDTNR